MQIAKPLAERLMQDPVTVWLTGLSGSGKSTIALALEKRLKAQDCACFILDGDVLRQGLNRDLGFSHESRTENIRRTSEVARLLNAAGLFVIVAFISPYRQDRQRARETIGAGKFIEVYVNASLEVCEQRDPKGLYKKVRAGQIPEFTGVTAPYEAPLAPELVVFTDKENVEASLEKIWKLL